MPSARVEEAIRKIAAGEPVVVVDDADRENEGDLIVAAEKATPASIGFMVRHTSGVICVAVPGARCDALSLPLMVPELGDTHGTAFTVTVDATHGTTTGISASDRATTIRALASGASTAHDFVRPGHVFPLRARDGGVLRRRGHTEAASDLARLAGLSPIGALAELVHDDGTMMRLHALEVFAHAHRLALLHIDDLVAYRRRVDAVAPKVFHFAAVSEDTRTVAGEAASQQRVCG